MHLNDLIWRKFPESTETFAEREQLTELKQPRIWLIALMVTFVLQALLLLNHLTGSTDYVGIDPDDTMRLVQIRDFLAGQSWFDMHQYRLGLDGGTLMHWSRLVDLPIALLIQFFSLFSNRETAEMLALAVWPLALVYPLMAAQCLAGYRLGGSKGMVMIIAIGAISTLSLNRFQLGAIDHHNVQIVLVATIAAMLIDPSRRASNFALAGLCAAIALAVGAETTPLMAMVAIIVAVLWAWFGEEYRKPAASFAAAFGLCATGFFFLTTPSSLYGSMACDNLSTGYLVLTITGTSLLAIAALFVRSNSALVRCGALVVVGVIVGVVALTTMLNCLRNPLGNLDPLLVSLWLKNVVEARSFSQIIDQEPALVGAYFAVGFVGLLAALSRIWQGDRVLPHAILGGLLLVALPVTLIQIRGMIFSNLIGMIIMSAMMADMHNLHRRKASDVGIALGFLVMVLISMPPAWTVGGVLAAKAIDRLSGKKTDDKKAADAVHRLACANPDGLRKIGTLPKGRLMAASNYGSALLRYTPHSIVAAPYHRNQIGMLTEIRAGTATPEDAEKIVRNAGITYVAFCRYDAQSTFLATKFPDSFYAELIKGHAPAWLEHIKDMSNSELAVFRVRPTAVN